MRWPWSGDDWRWVMSMIDLAPEPVTRADALEALVYVAETKARLLAGGAPADCIARLNAHLDHLLDIVNGADA